MIIADVCYWGIRLIGTTLEDLDDLQTIEAIFEKHKIECGGYEAEPYTPEIKFMDEGYVIELSR
jgi:hypothetical protein